MPLLRDGPLTPAVTVRSSVAVEISWALAAAQRPEYQRDNEVLSALYGAAPALEERVRSFWQATPASTCEGHLELLVLAHHGNLLFSDDATVLLARLDDLCRSAPTDLPLLSETAEDRAVVLERLARLRSSRTVRQRYVQLVSDVWSSLRDQWQREGRPAVEAAVAARNDLLAKGLPWQDIVPEGGHFGDLLPRLVNGLRPDEQFAVVPAYFTHKGMVVALPGLVVLGVRTDERGASERARTALLARRLKAVADPTRLTILSTLTARPRTITELATMLSLAQPTVSNHIKVLDEGGLVEKSRNGSRREIRARPDAVGELMSQLHTMLATQSG
jgi:DNA-binding transcriptional ArsR family regulator